jgi:hypothetical protein
MICGKFSESKEKHLSIDDVDMEVFVKVLGLWCGYMEGKGPWKGRTWSLERFRSWHAWQIDFRSRRSQPHWRRRSWSI